jgi:hypothetical protein
MINARVESAIFINKIREFATLTKRALSEVVLEQGRLLALRLTQLTYPKTASVGKKRVAIDIGKVYLQSKWFTDIFSFRETKYGDRIQDAVRRKDTGALTPIFQNSAKLRLIRLESFDPSRHAKLRRDGRIKIPNPNSFPVADQGKVKSFANEKKKAVGTAKSGWAACASLLGKSQPSWLNKSGTGSVENKTQDADRPYLILTNSVSYFSVLDSKAHIVSRALEGRGRDMMNSAKYALKKAAKQADLD